MMRELVHAMPSHEQGEMAVELWRAVHEWRAREGSWSVDFQWRRAVVSDGGEAVACRGGRRRERDGRSSRRKRMDDECRGSADSIGGCLVVVVVVVVGGLRGAFKGIYWERNLLGYSHWNHFDEHERSDRLL